MFSRLQNKNKKVANVSVSPSITKQIPKNQRKTQAAKSVSIYQLPQTEQQAQYHRMSERLRCMI